MRCPAPRIVAALTVTAALCACIALKEEGSPDPDRRDNIDEHAGGTFRAGIATREDVLLTLGEPAAAATDGRWLEYRSTRNFGHWSFYGCGYYTCSGFETEDKIRHRTLTVYFDAAGRVREIINDDRPAGPSPEVRLLDRHSLAVMEPGEGVVERLTGAQRRVADIWRPGVIIVTDRAIVFLETADTGPVYRLALRLPTADIQSVDWAEGASESGEPHARVRRVDGSSEAFALTSLSSGSAAAVSGGFDRDRTQHFIDIAGWLPLRGSRKLP